MSRRSRSHSRSVFVTPRGFEPPTNRTGICHSIQLNYGAGLEGYKYSTFCAFQVIL